MWAAQTPQGFGTSIVLGVDCEQMKDVCHRAMSGRDNCCVESVIDPDYVITVSAEIMGCIDQSQLGNFEQSKTDPTKYLYHRSEVTCAYIFGDKEKLTPLLSGLPLYS